MSTQNPMYPLDWVKAVCETIYKRPIKQSTWWKWKRLCRIGAYSKHVTHDEATHLMTAAYLKRQQPFKKLSYLGLRAALLDKAPTNKLKEHLQSAYWDGATGRELPKLIFYYVGASVSLRTLYRWAKAKNMVFGAAHRLSSQEILFWMQEVANRKTA